MQEQSLYCMWVYCIETTTYLYICNYRLKIWGKDPQLYSPTLQNCSWWWWWWRLWWWWWWWWWWWRWWWWWKWRWLFTSVYSGSGLKHVQGSGHFPPKSKSVWWDLFAMSNNNIFIVTILYLSLFQTSTCWRGSWSSWSSRGSRGSGATCSSWKSFDHSLNWIQFAFQLNWIYQFIFLPSIDLNLQIMNLIINSTMMSKILTSWTLVLVQTCGIIFFVRRSTKHLLIKGILGHFCIRQYNVTCGCGPSANRRGRLHNHCGCGCDLNRCGRCGCCGCGCAGSLKLRNKELKSYICAKCEGQDNLLSWCRPLW